MQDPEIIITEIDEQLFLFVIEEIHITAYYVHTYFTIGVMMYLKTNKKYCF